jgi:hypothetical protein
VTDRFLPLAAAQARTLGVPDAPAVVIRHPLGGITSDEVAERANTLTAPVFGTLRGDSECTLAEGAGPAPTPDELDAPAEWEEFQVFCADQGWSDGLPLVAPTVDRVNAMLDGARMDAAESLGQLAPLWAPASVSKVAVNAVMAGCLPAYLPVVLAAVEAMTDPAFNAYGVQTTTHPVGPLLIVNGPIASRLGINGAGNCFGPGVRANATIGRAIRLVLQNIGGGTPRGTDRATMGQPGKYTACIAENEMESPWESLHVERGFDASQSAVTVLPAEAPHNINDHGSISADGILTSVAGTMSTVGTNDLYWQGETSIIMGPEHAATVARDGLGKSEIRCALHERARVAMQRFSELQRRHFLELAGEPDGYVDACGSVALVPAPERINIIVAGGPGKHSMWVPSFGLARSVTRAVHA